MKLKINIILIALIPTLMGCVVKKIPHANKKYEVRLEADKRACEDVGYVRGTRQFGECMLHILRRQKSAEKSQNY